MTLFAPLKQGMVGSLEAVTYKSRAKRLLEILHGMRSRSHEYAYMRLISDAVERVGVIQSVRVVVVEPQDLVLLSVSFDGNWESYLRVLWHRVGALLDLIFCNTEGYVDARLNGFEQWAAWVRRVQSETSFFYGPPAATARDVLFQRRQERRRLALPADDARDVREATDVLPSAETDAASLGGGDPGELNQPISPVIGIATQLQQGLRGAAALYRLTDLHLPGSADGDRLHRAATELLGEFVASYRGGLYDQGLDTPEGKLRERFARELAWLFGPATAPDRATNGNAQWPADLANVQGGILDGWRGITHGALVMMSFDTPAAAARLLDALRSQLATAATSHDVARGAVVSTIALTSDGLYAIGGDSTLLKAMPEEFRQGMAARCGLLGDVRGNHPDRWRPPLRHQGDGRIGLDAVHAVVQLRTNVADDSLIPMVDTKDPKHPLRAAIDALDRLAAGARVLAVEPMRRLYRNPAARDGVFEHFGFADGMGQPQIAESVVQPDYAGNVLPVGELLLGYRNSAEAEVDAASDAAVPDDTASDWLRDGSFLVVRKYREFVDRFETAIRSVQLGSSNLDADIVAAKLIGRDRQGHPLADLSVSGNAFDYTGDRDGRKCPLSAHIRRGNPRDEAPTGLRSAGSRPARIMRRGLSFGPTVAESAPDAERGLIFMAYNASLGEQFEVVQRWMVGGNSTGSSSGASCPLLGVPEGGRKRHFRFVHAGQVLRAELDGHGPLFDDPQPLVQLEWGAYLWVPSLDSLDRLIALACVDGAAAETAWDLSRGRALLAELLERAAEPCPHSARMAWKAALEDIEAMSGFESASLWAAVREDHGGVLRTPYGVLVGEHAALHRTLADPGRALSVAGYQHRMRASLGEIYLGLDDEGPGCRYQSESDPVNDAIGQLDADDAFKLARDTVMLKIENLVAQAKAQAEFAENPRYETTFEPRELFDEMLARLCEAWCGLTVDGGRFTRGPARWDWKPGQPPQYPGHFTAPSRHTFQPHPGEDVEAFGIAHGHAIRGALRLLVEDWRRKGVVPSEPLAKAVVEHPLARNDADFAARTLAGTVMGFVPTLDGALRALAHEWLRDGTFWSLRAHHGGTMFSRPEALKHLIAPLQRALQLRAVPDVIWRTATRAQHAGRVEVTPGETMVFGLASAAQQMLAAGHSDDARSMFGGVRAPGGPTHACPGYEAAMAVMLGATAGLVATTHALAPVHGTAALRIEGDSGVPQLEIQRRLRANAEYQRWRARARPMAANGTVMIWGDSWIDWIYRPKGNFAHQFELADYAVPGGSETDGYQFDDWKFLYLAKMARAVADPKLKEGLQRAFKEFAPRAILLSGGGNDATSKTLLRLVRPKGAPNGPLNRDEVQTFVHGELKGYFLEVIGLIHATPGPGGVVPVVLHGYDHPLPWPNGGQQLGPFLCGQLRYTGVEAAGIMKDLINELNKMIATLPQLLPGGKVTYVDLTGMIAQAGAADPKVGWANELHPTPEGFAVLAKKIMREL